MFASNDGDSKQRPKVWTTNEFADIFPINSDKLSELCDEKLIVMEHLVKTGVLLNAANECLPAEGYKQMFDIRATLTKQAQRYNKAAQGGEGESFVDLSRSIAIDKRMYRQSFRYFVTPLSSILPFYPSW